MPRGQFKHRYWFFADTPKIGRNYRVTWKDLWWRADSYSHLKHRGPLSQLSAWCEKCVAARHYAVTGKQLLISNDINSSFRPLTGRSLLRFFRNSQQEQLFLKREINRIIPNSTHLFSHWSIPLHTGSFYRQDMGDFSVFICKIFCTATVEKMPEITRGLEVIPVFSSVVPWSVQ